MAGRPVCRWAALSLSSIASTFFRDLLERDTTQYNHRLVAISTTGSDERAQKWLAEHNVPDVSSIVIYHDWNTMLQEGDFDIVYISTPHPLHYEETLAALTCKRHVLVEKPATMTAAQFRKCIALAKEKEVVLMEAMWTRYLPATQHLQREVLPRIGRVRRVFSDFSFPIVSPELSDDSRFLDKAAGAGSLLDQGVYALAWVDIALNTLNTSEATKVVHAHTHNIPRRSVDVDDITTVILKNGDATAIVSTSMTIPGSSQPPFYVRLQAKKAAPSVRIEGTEASIAIPFPSIRPEELHVQWYGGSHVDDDGRERDEIIRKPVDGWGIWYQADVIANAVIQGRPQTIGAEESLRVLEWMGRAREVAGIKYHTSLEQL